MAATRRLAVIMFTDMVGYSASTQADESGTLTRLREQEALVRPLLAEYRGREIKSTGDGLLVEFDSALKATQCAVEIQRRLHERNSAPGVVPVKMRIGIHLGDVEQLGDDIFGDAVNIAARVEPLAEPGGVCVSQQVFDQVHNKIPNPLEKLPPKHLKNLQFPVDIYRVALPWLLPEPGASTGGPIRLAVLPFANFSPDPDDGYFADGLTEELITLLSQLHEIRVIARTSVFQYKAASKSIAQIGSELGVATVLEGSVRKARDQVRITVQLIDVDSQEHRWANTYDRKLDDVFAIQTDVAKRIAKALKLKLRTTDEARLTDRGKVHPDSYLAYLKGRTFLFTHFTQEAARSAKEQFERAVALDPTNARAYSGLADATRVLAWKTPGSRREEWDPLSRAHAARALELDPNLAEAHCSLAEILWDDFEFPEAEKEFRRALALNPSYALAHHWYAAMLLDEARTEQALAEAAIAADLDPQSSWFLYYYALILLMLRRLDEMKVKLDRLRGVDKDGRDYLSSLAWYHYGRSDFPNALKASDQSDELKPGSAWMERIWIYAAMGERDKARKLLEQQEVGPNGLTSEELGINYAVVGDWDRAFHWYEKALETHELPLQVLRNEPTLEAFRRDPRFARILKAMNLA